MYTRERRKLTISEGVSVSRSHLDLKDMSIKITTEKVWVLVEYSGTYPKSRHLIIFVNAPIQIRIKITYTHKIPDDSMLRNIQEI